MIYIEEAENERRARLEKAKGEEAIRDTRRSTVICIYINIYINREL